MSEICLPDYLEYFDSMRRAGVPFNPSEAHGIAIGLLGAGVSDPMLQWQQAVYADFDPQDALAEACRHDLDRLFSLAGRQLEDQQLGLALFVPDDPLPGLNLGGALRDWAQGFLYGFGLAGSQQIGRLSQEGSEALQDFYQIAQMDTELGELDEQELSAATEVEEYMRVAVLVLHEEMQNLQSEGEYGA